ncbi:MAG: TraB/GumN family protein [Proteobacteria bacterium]|nr:TraB/GumN family protein [Pseudomonadota bacterium]
MQTSPAAQPETGVYAGAVDKGLLWKITSAEGKVGYLFGTIHSEDARVLDFPQVLLDAVKESPIFAMELVPNLPTIGKLMEAMRYQDGTRLEDKIGSELYRQVSVRLSDYGVPGEEVQNLKIWAAAMTLSVPVPETGMFLDFSLSLRAAAGGATLTALETLEEQVGFLQGLDEKNQIIMLQQVITEFAEMQQQNRQMVDIWLGRDLNMLAEVSRTQMAEMEPQLAEWFQKKGIDQRNAVMLKRALPLLKQGGIFIAVGALHLPGKAGLIAGIQQAGFKLEAIW